MDQKGKWNLTKWRKEGHCKFGRITKETSIRSIRRKEDSVITFLAGVDSS